MNRVLWIQSMKFFCSQDLILQGITVIIFTVGVNIDAGTIVNHHL